MKNILLAVALLAGLAVPALATSSGPGYQDPQNASIGFLSAACTSTGNCAGTANSAVQAGLASGNSVCSVNILGTFSGTLTFEESVDGQNYANAYVTPTTGAAVNTATTAFVGSVGTQGFPYFRVRMSSYTSGTAIVNVYCVPVSNSTVALTATVNTPAPAATYLTAGSPAPANLVAQGFNAGGGFSPIICTKQTTVLVAATTQATETVMIPSAAGKTTYICSVTMYGGTSAVTPVGFGLAYSATNTCGSLTAIFQAAASVATAPNNVSAGNGSGVIAQTTAGTALCFFNALTTPAGTAAANIMYEQF